MTCGDMPPMPMQSKNGCVGTVQLSRVDGSETRQQDVAEKIATQQKNTSGGEMKYKFDIQKDGGVEPVDWDKIDLPRSGPTRYPGEESPAKAEAFKAWEHAVCSDPALFEEFLEQRGIVIPPLPAGIQELIEAAEEFNGFVTKPCNPPEVEEAVKLLQEPVGPTPKFNPTSKAWEMPDEPAGTSDAVE